MRLLISVFAARWRLDRYKQVQAAAEALKPDDNSLVAERTRGAVMSHRDWMEADAARTGLQRSIESPSPAYVRQALPRT